MPEFRFIGLQSDIVKASLKEASDCAWMIYPTEKSCKEALTEFQLFRQPLNIHFLSIDEFKRSVIYSDKVKLQDEKRLICLYQSMSPADKAQFHIEKYPDIIDWGQHFFKFFEQLADECVDADELLHRMDKLDFDYQPWQYDNYKHMLQIREQYQDFIAQKGYTDAVFDLEPANIHLPAGIKKYVFVNQLYYSKLEKSIIDRLSERKLQVVIYFQGKEEWLNKENLKSRELNLDDAFPDKHLPFELKIYQSSTVWQMALSFLQNHLTNRNTEQREHFFIDAQFSQQPYHTVFSKDYFQYAEPCPIHETSLFHFWQIITKSLDSMVKAEGKALLKTDWLLQAIGMDGFIEYFRPDWDSKKQDIFIASLCRLSENDILYLDLELVALKEESFPYLDSDSIDFLKDVMSLLRKLLKVNSIKQLLELIDVTEGIRIEALLSEQEKTCSNLKERFYEALANFMSIDELALVEDWQSLYPESNLAGSIFDLFLTFLKPKTYTLHKKEPANTRPVITNLMDTRNLQAERVTFLNLVEGVLPAGRETVWLFNERQNKDIGLKTWEDIRNWERYYFYRLLANAKTVELYTVANQDKDIEPSSFINEIFLFAQQNIEKNKFAWQQSDLPAQTLLLNWLKDSNETPLAQEAFLAASDIDKFLNLPCDKQLDFGAEQQINLSWSACEHFIRSPFVYYLRDVSRLKERIVRLDETLNRKMFGNLLHRYLMVITQRLAEQHQGTLSMKWEWINTDFLTANLQHALSAPILTYQIPQNYNWEYVKELLSPFLVETARWFFQVGLAKDEDFDGEIITIIPESERMTEKEKQYKLLLKADDTEQKLGIAIRGRADLRLETKDMRFIIDFKTGDSDKLQLLFYMWSYYLIEQPELDGKVRSAIYKLMEKQLKWLDNSSKWKPDLLPDTLKQALDKLISSGYTVPTDAKNRRYFIDITRADLLLKLTSEEEENE